MTSPALIERLRSVLVETFPGSLIPEDIANIQMGDFKEWDSLGNFNFLLAVESAFGVRFSMEQIAQVKSTGQVLEILGAEGIVK